MTRNQFDVSPSTTTVEGLGALTSAEVRITREQLGVTAEWVAQRLEVLLRTVRRWEAGDRQVPESVAAEYSGWVEEQEAQVEAWADVLLDTGDPVLVIPRAGDLDGWPAGWWRAVAGRVVEHVPGLRVVYAEDNASTPGPHPSQGTDRA